MFWKKKPISLKPETVSRVHKSLDFLNRLLGDTRFKEYHQLSLDRFDDFDLESKEDAQVLFDEVIGVLGLQEIPFLLDFFWEKPIETHNATSPFNTADLYRMEHLKLGTYQEKDGKFIVSIAMNTLKDKRSFIYVLAHELAHYMLQGEYGLFFNDEYAVDLMVLVAGFGPFWVAAQPDNNSYFDTAKMGYLTREEGIYALAKLEKETGNQIRFPKEEKPKMAKTFETFLKQLNQNTILSGKHLDKERELLPVYMQYCIQVLENKVVDIGPSSTFIDDILLYNRQAERGNATKFKKSRKKIVANIVQGFSNTQSKNELELQLIQKAINQIALYSNRLIQDDFFHKTESVWKQDITSRNKKIASISEDFAKNKKLEIEELYAGRKELMQELTPILQEKIASLSN